MKPRQNKARINQLRNEMQELARVYKTGQSGASSDEFLRNMRQYTRKLYELVHPELLQ